ncbi:uncharacterized protein BX663DRAFT_313364 [Cokeromyces recurvatus]|uniref:uncharacterized protein n=1 Tax=Cokeromyces recurvatus TaxID=90255 RepID=UPI002220F72E|nr:uncharacterized protein BX663DRAFT_313364 [Cokeromyces recurvatus]KAI7905182.1 hypothetical protein BX663DRAFT_313364 [Cokeromyces recurvatus]
MDIIMIDIRSMKSIIEWKGQPSCTAQFSFDENSIYSVNNTGELCQWSIHKPGTCIFSKSLEGFPPPPPPPPSLLLPTNSSYNAVQSFLLSTSPRPQMVAFSSDTNYIFSSSSNHHQQTFGSIYRTSSQKEETSSILQFGHESMDQQYITSVDWTTHTSNVTCLLGNIDGNIKALLE